MNESEGISIAEANEQSELAIAAIGAASDQQVATIRDFGRIIGAYYQSLIEHGIPKDLAREFVSEWHTFKCQFDFEAGCTCDPEDEE